MRLPITLLGAALLVVFAISAIAATSAMAAPVERGLCKAAKKGAGEYLNARCTEPGAKGGAKKEFVWVPVAKAQAFTTTSGEATLKSFTPEGAELPPVTCNKSKGKGKATATTTELVVTFEECSAAGEQCTGGAKAKAGQIVTKTLDGVLGTISGGTGAGEAVGAEGGGVSAEFRCGANTIATEGAVIGELSPVNTKASTTATETFNATGSTQEFESLEGGPSERLQAEINGLGGGTFPFRSVLIGTLKVKMPSLELRVLFA